MTNCASEKWSTRQKGSCQRLLWRKLLLHRTSSGVRSCQRLVGGKLLLHRAAPRVANAYNGEQRLLRRNVSCIARFVRTVGTCYGLIGCAQEPFHACMRDFERPKYCYVSVELSHERQLARWDLSIVRST